MPDLTVTPIDKEELPFVWPLVRAGGHDLGLRGWLLDGRALMARGGAILAARAPDSTFFGVATCEAVERGTVRVLDVGVFVAFELSRDAPVRRALTDAVEALAEELGCRGVTVPEPNAPLIKELRKRRNTPPSVRTCATGAAERSFR